MVDPAVEGFLSDRKKSWLETRMKSDMEEHEVLQLSSEADQKFNLSSWLPDAARRAGQIGISTHPCTFSHSGAGKNYNGKTTPVIADAPTAIEGYLKSGAFNVSEEVAIDASGNAAAIDVFKFLTLKMTDGQTLLSHIQGDSTLAQHLLAVPGHDSDELRKSLLAVSGQSEEWITSAKIKQVYFPTQDGGYHLLSILSNSGLIFEAKRRIDNLRFGKSTKTIREKRRNSDYSAAGYKDILDLTVIGYGGTKPQNVSVINSQHGGKAYLLSSLPPSIETSTVQIPTRDFFIQSIRYYDCAEPLTRLHGVFRANKGNPIPTSRLQSGRDQRIADVIRIIVEKMHAVRAARDAEYQSENTTLPRYQRVWLYGEDFQEETVKEDWLESLIHQISQWIMNAYEFVLRDKSTKLGEYEKAYIKNEANKHRELFR